MFAACARSTSHMTRRTLFLGLMVGWCLLLSERPAHAYMDPGSGSMFLQLVLGGAAGIALIGKLYWRRFLGFFGLRQRDEHTDRQSPN